MNRNFSNNSLIKSPLQLPLTNWYTNNLCNNPVIKSFDWWSNNDCNILSDSDSLFTKLPTKQQQLQHFTKQQQPQHFPIPIVYPPSYRQINNNHNIWLTKQQSQQHLTNKARAPGTFHRQINSCMNFWKTCDGQHHGAAGLSPTPPALS